MKLTEKQKNCQLHKVDSTGMALKELVTGSRTAYELKRSQKTNGYCTLTIQMMLGI